MSKCGLSGRSGDPNGKIGTPSALENGDFASGSHLDQFLHVMWVSTTMARVLSALYDDDRIARQPHGE